jgi:hypothetical protein
MGGSNQMLEPGNVSVAAPYFVGSRSGTIAAGLGVGDVFSLRNLGRFDTTDPSRAILNVPINVSRVRIGFASVTAFTAGGFAFEAFKATAFTAQATGGTAVLAQKRKTTGYPSIPATEIDAMIANTAALTPGTYSVAAGSAFSPLAPFSFAVGTGTLPAFEGIWSPSDLCPLILEQNEGIIIRNAVPQVSGTGILYVTVDFLRQ